MVKILTSYTALYRFVDYDLWLETLNAGIEFLEDKWFMDEKFICRIKAARSIVYKLKRKEDVSEEEFNRAIENRNL